MADIADSAFVSCGRCLCSLDDNAQLEKFIALFLSAINQFVSADDDKSFI